MNAPYRLPFDGKQHISSPYGWRTLNGARNWHSGFDVVADEDKHVRAVIGGTVKSSTIIAKSTGNLTWQWGNYVKVLGTDGLYWFYCHMASRAVKVGDTVNAGDILGVMGNTGYSFGAHTHVEVRNKTNTALDIATVLGVPNIRQSLMQATVPTPTTPPTGTKTETIESLQKTKAELEAKRAELLSAVAAKKAFGVVLGAYAAEADAQAAAKALGLGNASAAVVRY